MTLANARKTFALGLASCTATAAFALGQSTVPTPRVVETARVNVVNVEAFVTGRDGRPVPGLRREDFEVFEDGKPVTVTNFAALVGAGPLAAEAAPSLDESPLAAAVPATEGAELGPAAATPEGMLSLVIYVDNANISLTRRNEVLTTLRALLRDLVSGGRTQVMMVSGGPSVQIRQEFTTDAGVLTASLDNLQHEATEGGGTSGAETSMVSRMMDRTSMSGGAGGSPGSLQTDDFSEQEVSSLLIQARSAAEAEYERTRAMLGAMTQFVSSLAGLPGRKVMFYVGRGLPMRPGEELLQKFEALYGNSGIAPGFSAAAETSRFNVINLFRELVRRANAGQVTIYCVEASGDVGRGATAVQTSMTADPGIQTGSGMGLRQSLDSMAGPTGGETIASGASLELALTRVIEDVGSYYSLGYTPPHGRDGGYHTLKVRVKHEGASVRAREGYLDWSPDDRMAARSLSGLLFNLASNPLGATISVKPEGEGKGNTYAMTVLVSIPLDKLLLQPQGEVHEGSVSLWLASLGPDNRVLQAKKQVFPIRIPNEKLLTAVGRFAGYTFRLNLRKGLNRFAVSVRDDLGETESTLTASFPVGDNTAEPGPS
jgi:VWFA-related protein